MAPRPTAAETRAHDTYTAAVQWCRSHDRNWLPVDDLRRLAGKLTKEGWVGIADRLLTAEKISVVILPGTFDQDGKGLIVYRIHHPDLDHYAGGDRP